MSINVVQHDDEYRITFPFDYKIKELVKNVLGRRWNPDGKYWSIPASSLGLFIAQFEGTPYEDMVVIKSNEHIAENQSLDTTTSIPDVNLKNTKLYVKNGGRLYSHQLDFMKYAVYREKTQHNMSGFLCCDEMGCISKDTELKINYRKSGNKVTVEHLYNLWIKHPKWHLDSWSFRIRILKNSGKFGLCEIKDVIYKGKKPVYELKLDNGYSIKLTADHEVLTKTRGYIEAQYINDEDEIIVDGQEMPYEVVHHRDENPLNNDVSNLELTDIYDHWKIQHAPIPHLMGKNCTSRSGSEVAVIPKTAKKVSYSYVGIEDTYDISINSDSESEHNFVANRIVVHNCGKTLESLNLALYNKRNYNFKHCLILCCVNTSKYNWKDEIDEQTNGEYEGYILGSRKKKNGEINYIGSSQNKLDDLKTLHKYGSTKEEKLPYFIILNVEAIRMLSNRKHPIADQIIELINQDKLNMIIIDEVHKNLSPSSQQGKQILRIKKNTGSKCMFLPMTGTPIVNKPTDLFTPLRLIDAHQVNSFYKWNQQFCVYGGFGGHEILGYKNLNQLKSMLRPNMIRRTKDQVLDLPDKIEMTEYVENSPYQNQLMQRVTADLLSDREHIVQSLNPLSQMLRLRQVNGAPELVDLDLRLDNTYLSKNAKLKRLLELVADIISRDEKVVIFSNWVEPLRTVYRFLKIKNYKVCCFTGTMKDEERQKHKKAFIENPEYKIILGTIGALGTTHTLTVANNVIFYDEPWQAADKHQAEDRIHRVGTTKTCNIYTLISKGTIDERVHKIIYNKAAISDYIVDGKLDVYNNPDLFDYLVKGDK